MLVPTETDCGHGRRLADFPSIPAALAYAGAGRRGLNFYSGRGQLTEVLPYVELQGEAIIFAGRLRRAGLKRGDRVGLLAQTGADFVRAFLGCQIAGLVPVPLPLPAPFGGKGAYVAHLTRLLHASRSDAAFGPARLMPTLAEASRGQVGKLLSSYEDVSSLPEGPVDAAEPDENAIAYLQYSSGSTRFPLGVAVTHRALMANIRGIARSGLAIRDGDRGVSWLPMFHDMGLVGFLLTPVAAQVSVDYLAPDEFARRPLAWLQLIGRNRGTLSYSPSFGYELCVRRAAGAELGALDLSSWRVAGIGGDMIRPHAIDKFRQAFAPYGFDRQALVASYGMAEATLAVSFAPLGRGLLTDRVDVDLLEHGGHAAQPTADGGRRARDFVLCGPPLPEHRIEIRDHNGVPLGERQVGRVFVQGPSLMQGYFEGPEHTAEVLSADGWLDTGDLGYWCGGSLVVTGRAKDLILINGRNVWPEDIEWSLERAVGLRGGDAAAVSLDGEGGESVAVLVQTGLTDAAARANLECRVHETVLSMHGLAPIVVLVPPRSLPRTSSGKLSRARARRMYFDGAFG